MKEDITIQAQNLLDTISELYNNADHPDYKDLLTIETYLNIILRMTEEVR